MVYLASAYVHYSQIYVPYNYPTAPASPTATMAPTASQGEVDENPAEQSPKSNHTDSSTKVLIPKDFGVMPVPRHLRYDPVKPFHFGLVLNIGFGLASTFSECRLPSLFFGIYLID